MLFGTLLERWPLGAAMTSGAGLLAAPELRARLLLLLAPAAEERLRQHGLGRAKPGKLRFQSLRPSLRRPQSLAQPADPLRERPDRIFLAP